MKTLKLELKKKVLIVDLPQEVNNFKEASITNNVLFADGKGNRTCLFIKFRDKLDNENINEYLENGFKRIILDYIEDDYEFLCKGSELTEEIASELCHNIGNSTTIIGNAYLDDVNDLYFWEYAIDAFITSVESRDFYWLKTPIRKMLNNGKKQKKKLFVTL